MVSNYEYIQKINPAVPEWRQAGLFKGGGGANGIRTSDTRIFSPMLYQLSYGTFFVALTEFLSSLAKRYFVLAGAKVRLFPILANFSYSFCVERIICLMFVICGAAFSVV